MSLSADQTQAMKDILHDVLSQVSPDELSLGPLWG
jgi:hypothetical protein